MYRRKYGILGLLVIIMTGCQFTLQDLEENSFSVPYEGEDDIESIEAFVQDNISYIRDEHRFDDWHTPAETWKMGYADCEDINLLYASMLDAHGYEVEVVYGRVHATDMYGITDYYIYHVWLKIDDKIYDATTKNDNDYFLKALDYTKVRTFSYDEALIKAHRHEAIRELFNYESERS